MSETSAYAKRPTPGNAAVATVAGWTDCDLDPAACSDATALGELGIRRAVTSGLPHRPTTLSPETEQDHSWQNLITTRFVIDAPPQPDAAMLYDLHLQGVRGIRFSLVDNDDRASAQLDDILRYVDCIAGLDWHVELALGASRASLARNEWTLTRFPVAICLSHLIDTVSYRTAADPNIEFILAMLHMGRTWIKLSGIAPPHDEHGSDPLAAFVTAAMTVRPDRVVWGTGAQKDRSQPIDRISHVVGALAALKGLIPNDSAREAVLATNPLRLYDF